MMSDGESRTEQAKVLVNAAGPWVDPVTGLYDQSNNAAKLRLVKGSHIVVDRKFEGDHSYIFQNKDNRIIFAIPYQNDFTLIGTTDQPWNYDEGPARISDDEIEYLCDAASEYFKKPVERKHIKWTYSGVRPLFDDKSQSASTVTRDFVFDYDDEGGASVLSIFGGKITTYRVLALKAIKTLKKALGVQTDDWTAGANLPGGNFPVEDFDSLVSEYAGKWPFLDRSLIQRLTRAYGTDTSKMLEAANSESDLGQHFGAGLYQTEIQWLIEKEFARTAEDVLWRRSKLGLHMSEAEQASVKSWFAARQVKTESIAVS